MEISIYRHGDKEYAEDLKYWSNAAGELHRYGQESIKERDLPHELIRAYHELWREGIGGSYCYLAEYMGEYGIAIINEFGEDYCELSDCTMGGAFQHMKEKAMEYSKLTLRKSINPKFSLFDDVKIILGENSGIFEGHEFVTFVPWNILEDDFKRIADILFKTVYAREPVTEILENETLSAKAKEDELRVTGLFYMKTLPGETKEEAEERFLNAIYAAGLDVCNASLKYELESEQDRDDIER